MTHRRNGQPIPSPVWFGTHDGRGIDTAADSMKVRRIRNNPEAGGTSERRVRLRGAPSSTGLAHGPLRERRRRAVDPSELRRGPTHLRGALGGGVDSIYVEVTRLALSDDAAPRSTWVTSSRYERRDQAGACLWPTAAGPRSTGSPTRSRGPSPTGSTSWSTTTEARGRSEPTDPSLHPTMADFADDAPPGRHRGLAHLRPMGVRRHGRPARGSPRPRRVDRLVLACTSSGRRPLRRHRPLDNAESLANRIPGPSSRSSRAARLLVPGPGRMAEDHGLRRVIRRVSVHSRPES